MKNLSILTIALFSTICTYAQIQAKGVMNLPNIEESAKFMSKGENAAFIINLEGISKKDAENEWKNFTKSLKEKAKQDRKSKEWLSDDAKISRISDNTIDIYADINSEQSESSSVAVWFDLGGAFINSVTHTEQANEAKKVLQNFIIEVYQHQAEDFLKAEEKTLGGFEKDLKKLEKDKKDYLKKIEDAKATIAKMEKNIEVNENDQKNKVEEIGAQKQAVNKAAEHVKDFDKIKS